MLKSRAMLVAAALASAMAAMSTSAHAAELVVNGGFETGDFTGWTLIGDTANSDVSFGLPATGVYSGRFGPVGTLGGISQAITTVAGGAYVFSFDLQNYGDVPTRALVTFGGQTVLNLTNSPAFGYTHFSYNLTATGALTTIAFRFQQDPSYFNLDNVSVASVGSGVVPEPATWAMLISGFGLVGAAMRRRRLATA